MTQIKIEALDTKEIRYHHLDAEVAMVVFQGRFETQYAVMIIGADGTALELRNASSEDEAQVIFDSIN